ncbi:hypothetical protein ACFYZB_24510 [Streptomyces sp. NPDC001852]|uniref:hypothetical protein n=1 Tax=Streptomyces sp. NPDC001852 TaxID=3364619 RepID=UPI0036BE8013
MPIAHDPASVILACGALAALALLVAVFVRFPATGIGLLMAGQCTALVFGSPTAVVCGLNLSSVDILVAAAMLATGVNLALHHRGHPNLQRCLLWVLCAVVLGSLLSGMATHGLQTAGNDARVPFLWVFGPGLYVVTARPSQDLTVVVVRTWTAMATLYAVSTVAWWWRFGVGSSSSQVMVAGHLVSGRGLPAAAALLIAQAAVMRLALRGTRPRALLLTIPLLLVVLLMQHRSAWTATAAMISGWLLLRPGRVVPKAITAAATALVGVIAVAVATALPTSRLTVDLTESASDGSSWHWRVMGWQQLIGRLHGPRDWLFGLPFGSGYERFTGTVFTGVNPHSYYVLMLLRTGIVGLALLSLIVVTSLGACGLRTRAGLLMWLLAAGEVAFSLTYEPSLPDGLLLGLLVRCAAQATAGPPLPAPRRRSVPPAADAPLPEHVA